jgi:hypothetical protein
MAGLKRVVIASLVQWIPLAVLTVLLSGLVYAAVQQAYRSSANDPQIQMAMDARNALDGGAAPQSLVPRTQIDIAHSYAPYLVVYDSGGNVLAASATLHDQPIVPPAGVFASARATQQDLVTWMPEPGVRSAIVVVPYSGGYVLAGRSLTLVEQRESDLELIVAAACLATLAATLVAIVAVRLLAWRLAPAQAETL